MAHHYGLYFGDQAAGGAENPDPWAIYIPTAGNKSLVQTLVFAANGGPTELAASGAPTGACVSGSTYRRTDGTGSSLYGCKNSAWAALN